MALTSPSSPHLLKIYIQYIQQKTLFFFFKNYQESISIFLQASTSKRYMSKFIYWHAHTFVLYNNPSYSRILIGSCLWSIRGQTHDWRHHYRVFCLCRFKTAESFENYDNILLDWAKDKVQKSLAEAEARKRKVKPFLLENDSEIIF